MILLKKKKSIFFFFLGTSFWLLVATLAKLPVSTTHAITGATVGFGLVTQGAHGIHWNQIAQIGSDTSN